MTKAAPIPAPTLKKSEIPPAEKLVVALRRREMFIEAVTRRARPPPGGPCLYYESLVFTIDMALLTEGAAL